MLHTKKSLKLFEQLGRMRPITEYALGSRLGRGFADIGFEEFVLLPDGRVLSLFTGNISALDEVRREHLFEILTADQLIAVIHEKGYEIESLRCQDMRTWAGSVRNLADCSSRSYESASLEELLLSLLLQIFNVVQTDEARCLKTVMVSE